jgi:AcrR family transcriptional regulator
LTIVMNKHALLSDETRVDRRKRQTRKRIFNAAMELFVKNGLEETTVAEIADAADIGKGTFFTYFPTKESIFADVSARLVEAMDHNLAQNAATDAPLGIRLLALFKPAIEWHASNPVLSRHMLAAFLRDPSSMSADRVNQHRLFERLAAELMAACAEGTMAEDFDLRKAIMLVAGVYFGSLAAWHGAQTQTSLATDFADSLAIALRGLGR